MMQLDGTHFRAMSAWPGRGAVCAAAHESSAAQNVIDEVGRLVPTTSLLSMAALL